MNWTFSVRRCRHRVDDSPRVAAKYGIRGAPTILVFKEGKESARHVGVTTEKRLRELAGI